MLREIIQAYFKKKLCLHEWEVNYDSKEPGIGVHGKEITRTKRTLICKKCGEIKQIYI